jgi:hypothetical protein
MIYTSWFPPFYVIFPLSFYRDQWLKMLHEIVKKGVVAQQRAPQAENDGDENGL